MVSSTISTNRCQSCQPLPDQTVTPRVLKESFPGAKAYAVAFSHNANNQLPREPTLPASLPSRPRINCLSPLVIIAWAGRNTQSITRSAYALNCLSACFRHYLSFWLLNAWWTWLTTVNKTHRNRSWLTHTESFAEWQKADTSCTSRAFKLPGHDVTRRWRLAHRLDWLDIGFRAWYRWSRSPSIPRCSSSSWRGTTSHLKIVLLLWIAYQSVKQN